MLKNILLITIFTLSGTAYADHDQELAQSAENFTTHKVMGAKHYKGQNLIRIRHLATQKLQAMGENVSDYELMGVTIRAKSKRGKGKATLLVGPDQDQQTVPQFGGDVWFDIDDPWAYQMLHWDLSDAPGGETHWQIRLKGNIKIGNIQVHLASRTKRIRIPLGGILLAGQSTIRLKRELRDLGYNMKGKKLRKVVLVAKSRKGHGKAELQIGQQMKPQKAVLGSKNGFGFQANQPKSYNRVRWAANGPTKGVWQIHTRGRVKVKAVIVEIQ